MTDIDTPERQDSEEDKSSLGVVATTPLIAQVLEKTQINKYHVRGGWGFSAEDANALADRWQGKKVECVGTSNTLNGADRISDGVLIQSKYCYTVRCSIESAFGPDGGSYRYSGQVIEVPKDQYAACVEIMREKIRSGQVPGTTDPAAAETMVKAGHTTYDQARKIAQAGTFSGVWFDMKTHAMSGGIAAGLSGVISVTHGIAHKKSLKDIAKSAAVAATKGGAVVMAMGVATSQVLRTRAGAIGRVVARKAVGAAHDTNLGKVAIKKLAAASLGKAVSGGAAINHVAKLARSNVVSNTVSMVISTTPDMYRATIQKSISWTQLGKNFAVRGSSSAGGAGGWAVGAIGGAAIGSAVPIVGTAVGGFVGGLAGSLSGGWIAELGSKNLLDRCAKDDDLELLATLPAIVAQMSEEMGLTEEEATHFSKRARRAVTAGVLRDWQASADRDLFIKEKIKEQADLAQRRILP